MQSKVVPLTIRQSAALSMPRVRVASGRATNSVKRTGRRALHNSSRKALKPVRAAFRCMRGFYQENAPIMIRKHLRRVTSSNAAGVDSRVSCELPPATTNLSEISLQRVSRRSPGLMDVTRLSLAPRVSFRRSPRCWTYGQPRCCAVFSAAPQAGDWPHRANVPG
jgi:hypothetical protein